MRNCSLNKYWQSSCWSVINSIKFLFIFNWGSWCSNHLLWKCTHTVLVLENWKPFSLAHLSILFKQFCSFYSAIEIFGMNSQEKNPLQRSFNFGVHYTPIMLLIFSMNGVNDSMLPCSTPIFWWWRFRYCYFMLYSKKQFGKKFFL